MWGGGLHLKVFVFFLVFYEAPEDEGRSCFIPLPDCPLLVASLMIE